MEALVLNRSVDAIDQQPHLSNSHRMHTITGHAWLARNAGRDQDNLTAAQAVFEALGSWVVALDDAVGVDVSNISRDAYAVKLYQSIVNRPTPRDNAHQDRRGYRREPAP